MIQEGSCIMKVLPKKYTLKILRGTPSKQYWERFILDYVEGENIISALMRIRKKPVNSEGKQVAPIVWEDGCLEEVCGSCSMLINTKPRQACTALISELLSQGKGDCITLAPLTKFPLVRDLVVDRSAMFENLKKVQAWVEVDDYLDPKKIETIKAKRQDLRYKLSTCMTCGCCSESCPQVNEHSSFMGPAPIAQTWLFNLHPIGEARKEERLHELMQEGGVNSCGNAQNCVRVCPKNIPLTDAIGALSRDITRHAIRKLLSFPEEN